jgi:hypothetical protein
MPRAYSKGKAAEKPIARWIVYPKMPFILPYEPETVAVVHGEDLSLFRVESLMSATNVYIHRFGDRRAQKAVSTTFFIIVEGRLMRSSGRRLHQGFFKVRWLWLTAASGERDSR